MDRSRALGKGALAAAVAVVMLVLAGPAAARLRAPRLQGPTSGATVQSLPAFRWGGVRGAASYQFEFAADRHFSSAVTGFGQGPMTVASTQITNDKAIPDGTYYWRVRGMSATDHPGAWSPIRTLTKRWSTAPSLQSPLGTTVAWPTQPLLLKWSSVPYAVNYDVFIATDPSLSHLVLGSTGSPQQVQGPQFAFPTTLAPATYYWAIQPVDAEGNRGTMSKVGTFTWTWPSDTTVSEANVSTDAGVDEPSFAWNPVAGAASYEIEISRAQDFPQGSDLVDQTGIVAHQYTPLQFLPNETTLYWRVRARDINGDAGDWNTGQPFTENFDDSTPTVQNLEVVDQSGNVQSLGYQSDDIIVKWDPVPGASSYQVQLAGWCSASQASAGTCYDPSQTFAGCDLNNTKKITTPNTYFTPVGSGAQPNWEQTYNWPQPGGGIQINPGAPSGTQAPLCITVAAVRDDGPIGGSTVISAPTVLGNTANPGFIYVTPSPAPGGPLAENSVQQGTYLAPLNGSSSTATPLFTWNPVPGADAYYVAIARDRNFTNVVYVGYSQQTSYIPPISLLDATSSYYWEVVPVALAPANNTTNQTGAPPSIPQGTNDDVPQAFNKSSIPPTPIVPVGGQTVQTQPTFQWSGAVGARNYTLQVATDPTFANPLVNVTTDSTSYTSNDTLPADKTLYWRVRANDYQNTGLNWSWTYYQTSTFTHHLPAPTPSASNPTSGTSIPEFAWSPVSGAVSYNMFVTQANGSTQTFNLDTPYVTPTEFYGTGNWHWQVQAVFPGNQTSAYSTPASTYLRTIPAPGGVHATKSGNRILISWAPSPVAKQYQVQLSTTDGFSSPIAGDTTDNTVWAPQIDPVAAKQKLYWRLAVVDMGGNIGAYHQGVFRAPPKPRHRKHRH